MINATETYGEPSMNEFTKEELYYLLRRIDTIPIKSRLHIDQELEEKIQSMIDNYCDHKDIDRTSFNFTIRDEKLGIFSYLTKCENCGKYYE